MKTQRRLAADILDTSPKHIKFNPNKLEDVEDAISREDVRQLIDEGTIFEKHHNAQSKAHARHLKKQKSKGRRRGRGSIKSGQNAREPRKKRWMKKIRSQRKLLKQLKQNERIDNKTYRELYNKAKGGYFRSKRHIKLYLEQNELFHN